MPNQPISEDPLLADPASTDLVAAVDVSAGLNKGLTLGQLTSFVIGEMIRQGLIGETGTPAVTAQPNTPYGSLASGLPPSVKSYDLFAWFDSYEAIKLANVPRERATTYYFAQDGADDSGDGSSDSPWKTLVKAQAVITAASATANLRLRFKRGDTWRELTVLSVTKKNVTIDDWGDANDDAPLFTRFTHQPSGWVIDSGDRYKKAVDIDRGWLRDADDPLTPYWEQSTTAGVASTPRSFYHDTVGGFLYVNAGTGVNPNTKNLEYAPFDPTGWTVYKDNVRIQNVRIHGAGMHTSTGTPGYGLYIEHSDTSVVEECVLYNVEVYYSGYHAIGHIGANNTQGKSIVLIDCRAGFCTDRYTGGVHDATPYVSFSNYGQQEWLDRNCETSAGMLPSSGWSAAAAPNDRKASYGVYQHTNSSSYTPALSISIGHKFPDVAWQVMQTTYLYGPAWVSDEATELRAYIVEERPAADGLAIAIGYGLRDRAMINCEYHYTGTYKPTGANTGLWFETSADDFDGLAINCKLTVDASSTTSAGGGSGIWYGAGNDLHVRLENCRIAVTGIPTSTQIFMLASYSGAVMGARVKIRNSIITMSVGAGSTAGGWLGAGGISAGNINDNDQLGKSGAGRVVNNGYYLQNGGAFPMPSGYLDGDAGRVVKVAAIADSAPAAADSLYHAGADNDLEYDFNRARRHATTPSIGPLEV